MVKTGYESDAFALACVLRSAVREVEGTGLSAAYRRSRVGWVGLRRYERSLPSVPIRLTRSLEGRLIGEHLAIRDHEGWVHRGPQGMLTLPADYADYMRGRSRQAVRTNLGHARRAGLVVGSERDPQWRAGHVDVRRPHLTPGPVERWFVTDDAGAVVVEAIVTVDRHVALLHGMVARPGHGSKATFGRWMMHTAIVERLCGVCDVLLANTTGAYTLPEGARHFQRLLGYEIARPRLTHPRWPLAIRRGATVSVPLIRARRPSGSAVGRG
jgi:hypothetical protein